MPPPCVKTIRELIYWEYAKLISGSTTGDRKNYRFVMYGFQKLKKEEIHPSSILRENKMFMDQGKQCAYCGATEDLAWEHIIPKCKKLIDSIDNQVWACRKCNSSKGGCDPFEWLGLERRYEVPRLVLGKYLKLIFDLHQEQGTLDETDLNKDGKLNVYDLGVVLENCT